MFPVPFAKVPLRLPQLSELPSPKTKKDLFIVNCPFPILPFQQRDYTCCRILEADGDQVNVRGPIVVTRIQGGYLISKGEELKAKVMVGEGGNVKLIEWNGETVRLLSLEYQ